MNEITEETLQRNFLDMKYARIIEIIAERKHITREQAMDMLYRSPILGLVEEHISDLHCRSDLYLAGEVMRYAEIGDTTL